jgi:hypothetical protein
VKPKASMLFAICFICAREWRRAFWGRDAARRGRSFRRRSLLAPRRPRQLIVPQRHGRRLDQACGSSIAGCLGGRHRNGDLDEVNCLLIAFPIAFGGLFSALQAPSFQHTPAFEAAIEEFLRQEGGSRTLKIVDGHCASMSQQGKICHELASRWPSSRLV